MLKLWFKKSHWFLFAGVAALSVLGIAFIYSASHYDSVNYAVRQSMWIVCGWLLFYLFSRVSYKSLMGVSYLIYSLCIILLVGVMFFGDTRFGAQRWIQLGPFALQPSEFAKLATILALAHYLGENHEWENGFKPVLTAAALVLLPMGLIMNQPDLGTSMVFIPVLIGVLFLWGIKYRYLIFAFLGAVTGIPIMWNLLKPYQQKRILVFLNPSLDPLGAGYTAIQSRIAVGAGGLFGKGFMKGTQGQLEFVPEHHTDFIFCVIAEEWGFLGALLVLFLYGLIFYTSFVIISQTTDMKAKLLATGVVAVLFTQVFINIGMSFGLMPITGLTLPLVSYGGSSLMATCIGLGLLAGIYRERSIF